MEIPQAYIFDTIDSAKVSAIIYIFKDKYIDLVKKELVRKGLVQDYKVDPITNTVIVKTHLDKRRASLMATRAMMALGINKYRNSIVCFLRIRYNKYISNKGVSINEKLH